MQKFLFVALLRALIWQVSFATSEVRVINEGGRAYTNFHLIGQMFWLYVALQASSVTNFVLETGL